jgi:hypothetical protein
MNPRKNKEGVEITFNRGIVRALFAEDKTFYADWAILIIQFVITWFWYV